MAINPSEITTIRVGELPTGSVTVDSKFAVENGTDLEQVTGQQVVDFISLWTGYREYQVVEFYVTQSYIDENLLPNGLGVNKWQGLALCNGQNGAPPMDGLVSIGYGNNYNVVGAFGGSKDAVVVAHTHNVRVNTNAAGSGFPAFEAASAQGSFATESTGVSGIDKNMQPYIVLVKMYVLPPS